ncbi:MULTISPECIES: DUF1847 domain-containing protein [Clostridium]|uniref:Metal-binding protein n=1 Tax=Clostridium cadaveris TaxID=1529 RepID=A0A316M100_9CLOT|nr:DUF1847 domain-containing protein [Clostridium sp.]PWL52237.1 MAG: metal-binding protein [Clostridium cadaveris]
MYTCDSCKQNNCKNGDIENAPLNCPCRLEEEQEKIKDHYNDDEILNIAHNSALVESEGYCQKTRVEEIIDFAHKCGYKKIGVAFCIGLIKEAQIFCSILRHHGFEVESIVCKNGSIPKSFINISDSEQVRPGTYEPMCNPIGQAILLNEAHTDLNILLGLCVGHDSLFIKHSDAPITVFAVKDRVLCHNPLAAIYGADKYYKSKLFGGNR